MWIIYDKWLLIGSCRQFHLWIRKNLDQSIHCKFRWNWAAVNWFGCTKKAGKPNRLAANKPGIIENWRSQQHDNDYILALTMMQCHEQQFSVGINVTQSVFNNSFRWSAIITRLFQWYRRNGKIECHVSSVAFENVLCAVLIVDSHFAGVFIIHFIVIEISVIFNQNRSTWRMKRSNTMSSAWEYAWGLSIVTDGIFLLWMNILVTIRSSYANALNQTVYYSEFQQRSYRILCCSFRFTSKICVLW